MSNATQYSTVRPGIDIFCFRSAAFHKLQWRMNWRLTGPGPQHFALDYDPEWNGQMKEAHGVWYLKFVQLDKIAGRQFSGDGLGGCPRPSSTRLILVAVRSKFNRQGRNVLGSNSKVHDDRMQLAVDASHPGTDWKRLTPKRGSSVKQNTWARACGTPTHMVGLTFAQ